jgi:hypothetical protein
MREGGDYFEKTVSWVFAYPVSKHLSDHWMHTGS